MHRLARPARTALVSAAALALVAGACGGKKDKPKDQPGSGAVAGSAGSAAPSSAAPAAIAPASGVLDPTVERVLAALPVDADIVAGVSVERIMTNAAIRGQADKVFATGALPFDVKAECGIDPATAIKRVVVAVKNQTEAYGAMNGLAKAPFLACLEKARPKIEAEGGKVTVDGVFVWGAASGRNFGMVFIDDTMAMFMAGEGLTVEKPALEAMVASTPGSGLTSSTEFMSMIKKVNTDASTWVVGNGPKLQSYAGPAGMVLGGVKAMMLAVEASAGGIALDLRLRMTSDDAAKEFTTGMVGGQVKTLGAKGFATRAEITADGPDAHAVVTMSEAQVTKLVNMLKTMLGGLFKSATRAAPPAAVPGPATGSGSATPTAPAPTTP